jgi:high-affinity nickel-transport protein
MYALLLVTNIVVWVAALVLFSGRPLLGGAAILAYTFGLRHAVDADHISAIDNVTRKLMQEGKRPVAVGFFFSLGHSTIVIALSLAIALTATTIKQKFPGLESAGGLIGTSVSALFLYAVALINALVLWDIFQTFRDVRRGAPFNDRTLDEFLSQRGLIGRFCKPLLRLITRSWHMYLLGLLFGLGFDTATEVGLLGIAAMEAGKGLSIFAILLFPALFTAGMSLVDTTDGVLMLGAYGWAFVHPIRKLYYNMNVTLVSVLVALVVGTVEALSVVGSQLGLSGPLWSGVSHLSDNFGILGFAIVAVFLISWGLSTAMYRWRRYDELDVEIAS